ncbi:hypothetical protein [Colwellia piezophila]|jgi:hypothetical protein|uniref:hypothetical protein n=1 Tax=Colwellia piezophila TaxID=211668 RepID=UPI0003789975|nr:hypothetical protein [Colwellia piezophila]
MNKKKTQKIFREWALDFKAVGDLRCYEKWLFISNQKRYTDQELSLIFLECQQRIVTDLGIEELGLLISKKYAQATKEISNEAQCVLQHIQQLKNKK